MHLKWEIGFTSLISQSTFQRWYDTNGVKKYLKYTDDSVNTWYNNSVKGMFNQKELKK